MVRHRAYCKHFMFMVLDNPCYILLHIIFPSLLNQGIPVLYCKNKMEITLGVCISHSIQDLLLRCSAPLTFTNNPLLQIFRCSTPVISTTSIFLQIYRYAASFTFLTAIFYKYYGKLLLPHATQLYFYRNNDAPQPSI